MLCLYVCVCVPKMIVCGRGVNKRFGEGMCVSSLSMFVISEGIYVCASDPTSHNTACVCGGGGFGGFYWFLTVT